MSPPLSLRCSCGAVALALTGAPIVSVECLCESCRAPMLDYVKGSSSALAAADAQSQARS